MCASKVEQATFSADDIEGLVERVLKIPRQRRTLVSIAGAPGSGKSTLALKVANELKKSHSTVVLPQDGYHYYRHELAAMANPDEAFERRGAPFTYNVDKFVETVRQLRECSDTTVAAPSFDHKVKDPVEGDVVIGPDVEIVLVEGNYVSLPDAGWNEIEQYVDDTWYVDTDPKLVGKRIVKRHLEAGIAANEEEATKRADGSDMKNAVYIREQSKKTAVVIRG